MKKVKMIVAYLPNLLDDEINDYLKSSGNELIDVKFIRFGDIRLREPSLALLIVEE